MKSSELIKMVKRGGWYEVRQSGSHIIFRHKDSKETIVIPSHGSKEISTGLQKAILKQMGKK